MTRTFLAFDLGASSGRAMLGRFGNGKLEISEVHRFSNGPVEKEGSLFWDFDGLFGNIKIGIKKALAIEKNISGIGIDTWGVDYVLLGSDGKFVRQPYHYRDSRTNGMDEKVFSSVPAEELYRRTGLQYLQLNTIYQLYAHKEKHPEDFRNSTLLMMPDALTYLLCGKKACEYTDASTTNLLDAEKRDWDFGVIGKLGFTKSLFPKIVPPCTPAGTLAAALRKELSCGAIPVFHIGGHDTASAVASVPAIHGKKWAYLSCGTWSLLGAELDSPVLTEEARKANYTNEGGLDGKIRFLTNIMGLWLLQECSRVWKDEGKDYGYGKMAEMAAEAEPLRCMIDPNDNKFFFPCDMPKVIRDYCRGKGKSVPESNAAVVRCILDSLAACFEVKLRQLEKILKTKYEILHVIGGGCQNRLLMQLTADTTGIPVLAGPVEATAAGNLMAQAIASGDISSLDEGRRIVAASFPPEKFTPGKLFLSPQSRGKKSSDLDEVRPPGNNFLKPS